LEGRLQSVLAEYGLVRITATTKRQPKPFAAFCAVAVVGLVLILGGVSSVISYTVAL
jgi:hypothetical protein